MALNTSLMSDTNNHPIRDKVVAGLIVAFLVWMSSLIPGLWSSVWSFTRSAARWFFTEHVSLPVWLLVLLSLAAAVLLLVGFVRLVQAFTLRETTWYDYKSDRFFEMVWRWAYSSSGNIQDLCCFCPNDDTVLVPVAQWNPDRVVFRCDTCRSEFGPIESDFKEAIRKVKRQIDRKLRTDEWKQTVPKAVV